MIGSTTLDNGLRIITERIPHAHSVSIGIWVANGSRNESLAENGIAHFIEHLLFKGTATRSALAIAREIDSVGGHLNAFTSREYVCYYVKVLDSFLPKAVELLSDIFLNSLFNAEEIEKERTVILQEIRMMEDTPDDNIHDLFTQNFWQGHPLGRPILGSHETVQAINRDSLLSFKENAYRGSDIMVVAAGKLDHDELVAQFARHLASVPAGGGKSNNASPTYQRRVHAVSKDLEQMHFCLGSRALPQNHPQRYAGHILNTILGGSMSSRLFQEIREKRGLAYSAYSYLSSYSDAGSLVIYAGTSAEHFDEVINVTLEEMRKMRDELVPEEELVGAREQIKGNFLLSLESSDNRMTKLAKNEIYFNRSLTIAEILASINAVTAEEVRELGRHIFDDSCLTLQVIGNLDPANIYLPPLNS